MSDANKCRSCKADVVWIKLVSGKAMPCDPKVLSIVTEDGQVVRGRESHFGSCPKAAIHRARDKAAKPIRSGEMTDKEREIARERIRALQQTIDGTK